MPTTNERGLTPRFSTEINLGHVVELIMLGITLLVIFKGVVASNATISQKLDDVQITMDYQLGPTGMVPGHLHAIDIRLDSLDARMRAAEVAVSQLNAQEEQLRADLDNITRASMLPLPTRR